MEIVCLERFPLLFRRLMIRRAWVALNVRDLPNVRPFMATFLCTVGVEEKESVLKGQKFGKIRNLLAKLGKFQ